MTGGLLLQVLRCLEEKPHSTGVQHIQYSSSQLHLLKDRFHQHKSEVRPMETWTLGIDGVEIWFRF
jgi:hypothetical protein